MIVNGPDGKRYNLPNDATDDEITGLFGGNAPTPAPKFDTIPSHAPAFPKQSGTQRDVMGITSPAGRARTEQVKKPLKAFAESVPVGAAKIADTAAALIGAFAENPETSLASKVQRNITEPAIKYWEEKKTPEPLPTIGQNVASSLGELAPTLALGPAALPTMAGTATYQTGKELVDAGLPTEVAQTAAGMQGLGAAAMGAIPGAAPTLGKSAALALTNPLTGIAQRAATKAYLEPYNKEVAAGFDPLDPASLVMDVAMSIPGLAQHPRLKAEKAFADTVSRPADPVTAATPGRETQPPPGSTGTEAGTQPGQAGSQRATEPPPNGTKPPPEPEQSSTTDQAAPNLDFVTNNVSVDPNRLNFEIGLVKNKKTSKTAVLLPPDVTALQAKQIAANAKMRALKQGDELYIYDPSQIPESTLRNQIKSGKNGLALGYGTDAVPENGVPYAVDLDGMGTLDINEILSLRDASRLGFSGVAPDVQSAITKIQEMGRNDAEIRGVPLSAVEPNAKAGDAVDLEQGKAPEVTTQEGNALLNQINEDPAFSPAQRDLLGQYLSLTERVTRTEKTPNRRMSPEEVEAMQQDWKAYSKSRGYSDSEIADFVKLKEVEQQLEDSGVSYDDFGAMSARIQDELAPQLDQAPESAPSPETVVATVETPPAVAPPPSPGEISKADPWLAAQHEVDSIRDKVMTGDISKAASQHIVMDVQTIHGGEGVKLAVPYDGTEADAMRVAKALKMYASEEHNASMRDSAVFATDKQGQPKYAFTQGEGVTEIHPVKKPIDPVWKDIEPVSLPARKAKGQNSEQAARPDAPQEREWLVTGVHRNDVKRTASISVKAPDLASAKAKVNSEQNWFAAKEYKEIISMAQEAKGIEKPSTKKSGPRNILSDIRQQGGINVQSLITALDRNEVYGPKGGNRYLRVTGKNGVGVDQMAVQMADLGWQIPHDVDGRIDTQKFADILRESVNGNHPVHPDDVEMMLDRHPELSPEEHAETLQDVDEAAAKVMNKKEAQDALKSFDDFFKEEFGEATTGEAERIPASDEGEVSVASGIESTGEQGGEQLIDVSDVDLKPGERLWLRYGEPPSSGKSKHIQHGYEENGVSVMIPLDELGRSTWSQQLIFSMTAGEMATRDLYVVAGKQRKHNPDVYGESAFGSDGEPLITDARVIRKATPLERYQIVNDMENVATKEFGFKKIDNLYKLLKSEKPEIVPRFETTESGEQGVLLNGKREFGKSAPPKKAGRAVGTSELMDGFTSEESVQPDMFKQAGKAPSSSNTSHADTGGYSERTPPIRETTQAFLELPEVVKLAKLINEGKLPRLMEKLGNALGRFTHSKATGEASIQLRKDLFAGPQIAAESMKPADARKAWDKWQADVKKDNPDADIIFRQKFNKKTGMMDFKAYKRDPNFVLKVLSHEIGHNADYLKDLMIKGRGNIFGHIAALKRYMSDTLAMYPDAKGRPLTGADKARFAEEAKAEAKAEDIVETVTREVPKYEEFGITPDMITEIWNGMESARDKNPDLYKFIAKMSDADKKAVVVQAMKGVVHEALRRFAGKRQVGTETITETITRPGKISPEAIKLRTEQLIKEEILKRRLYEKDVVMDELKALTQEWKPFNDADNAKYTKYRYSAPELYADAVSVLFNEPQLLKDTAPTFYKSFMYYMGERPQFQEAYRSLSRLSKDPQALNADRYAEEMEMYKRGNEKAEEIRKSQKPGETVYNTAVRWLIDKNHDVLKDLPDTPEGREARYNLEEIPYIAGEAENHVRKAHNIQEGLKAEGVTIDDLSAYLLAKHIIANRSDIANTQGKTAKTEQAKLDWMRGELGERKFTAIEEAADQYTKMREHITKRIEESGIVTPELMDKIKNGVDYAHIDVQKYMDQKYGQGTAAGAGWKKMAEGTLSDINNVFTATILQDISIMRMAKINEAKRNVADVFDSIGLAKTAKMKYDLGFKGMRPVEPGGDQALLTVLRDGKPVYYVVDKHVADMFKYDPIKSMNIGKVAGIVTSYFRDILVSKNPAWMFRNLYRDFKGTVKNNPEVSFWNPMDRYKLLKAYKEAFKEVKADVFHGQRSADIEMMHNEHMLNSDRMYASTEDTFDSPLERIATEFRFGEQEEANIAKRKAKALYEYLDKLGKISEQTGKVAGMKYLRSKGLEGNELSHRVRTRIGTPDYKRQGALQQLTNNMFLFSNVNKEGMRSAIAAFKQDPISYTFKTVEANILPKVALIAAGAGLFGDELKDIVEAIPTWARRSYNIIPLPEAFTKWAQERGIAGKHDVSYIRLPSDYEGQFFGSLTYDLASGKYADALDDIIQQFPWTFEKIHPALKMTNDARKYFTGNTPYDDFRHKDVLTAEQQKYLEVEGPLNTKSLKGMGIHTYNMLGLGNIYRLDNKEFPKTKDPTEAAFKQVMRYLGGFVEFTDAGKQEQMVKGIIDKRNEKAIKSYEVGDAINQAIRDGKDKPSDIPSVYKSLVATGKIEPAKTRFSAFRTRYTQAIMQRDYGIKPTSKAEQKTLRDFAISQ